MKTTTTTISRISSINANEILVVLNEASVIRPIYDENNNLVDANVSAYTINRGVFLNQVMNADPRYKMYYNAIKPAFAAKGLDVKSDIILNSHFKDAVIDVKQTLHIPGETYTREDGTEGIHQTRKYTTELVGITFRKEMEAKLSESRFRPMSDDDIINII